MTEEPLPETLTLDDAFRAAFFIADQYMALEREPGTGGWSCSTSTCRPIRDAGMIGRLRFAEQS